MSIKRNCQVKNGRKNCLSCGHALEEEPRLSLSGMPASAQDIPDEAELSDDCGIELRLFRCPHCGLCQFDCEPVDYYKDVIRAVGLSETMRALRRSDYRYMIETYGLSGGKFLECGCGRGEFMEVLKEFPAEIYATEANAEFAAAAQNLLGEGCHVLNVFPDSEGMRLPGAPFDCFFSFNFLEHQPEPAVMLRAMYYNLRAGGYGLITVPSFEYILQEGRYYELIRDHIANYTLGALRQLCEDCGFAVLEEGSIGIGDTLRVVVQKPEAGTLEQTVHSACLDILKAFQKEHGAGAAKSTEALHEKAPVETKTAKTETEEASARQISNEEGIEAAERGILRLSENYDKLRAEIAAYTERLQAAGKKLALFGAGHQGFTIAATTALKDHALYMIDSAPFKQGRFAPASHIKIVSPEHFFSEPADVIMITAPGYAKEIEALCRKKFADYPNLRFCTIEPESYIL